MEINNNENAKDKKEKTKRHILFNLENNICINFKPEDLITDLRITKQNTDNTF